MKDAGPVIVSIVVVVLCCILCAIGKMQPDEVRGILLATLAYNYGVVHGKATST